MLNNAFAAQDDILGAENGCFPGYFVTRQSGLDVLVGMIRYHIADRRWHLARTTATTSALVEHGMVVCLHANSQVLVSPKLLRVAFGIFGSRRWYESTLLMHVNACSTHTHTHPHSLLLMNDYYCKYRPHPPESLSISLALYTVYRRQRHCRSTRVSPTPRWTSPRPCRRTSNA